MKQINDTSDIPTHQGKQQKSITRNQREDAVDLGIVYAQWPEGKTEELWRPPDLDCRVAVLGLKGGDKLACRCVPVENREEFKKIRRLLVVYNGLDGLRDLLPNT